jgi:hypothetical protein
MAKPPATQGVREAKFDSSLILSYLVSIIDKDLMVSTEKSMFGGINK